MHIDTGTHFLSRRRFIHWLVLTGTLDSKILNGSLENLILGGEHIVTAEEILSTCGVVPGYLIEVGTGVRDTDVVDVKRIKLVLKPLEFEQDTLDVENLIKTKE
jgi:hypothetical protein